MPYAALVTLTTLLAYLIPYEIIEPPGNNDAAIYNPEVARFSRNSSVFPEANWARGKAIFLVRANPLAIGYSIGTAVATKSNPLSIEFVIGLSRTSAVNLPIV